MHYKLFSKKFGHSARCGGKKEPLAGRTPSHRSTSTSVMVNCVREGVPVVIAHYDDRFAEKG